FFRFDLFTKQLRRSSDHQTGDEYTDHDEHEEIDKADAHATIQSIDHHIEHVDPARERHLAIVHRVDRTGGRSGGGNAPEGTCGSTEANFFSLHVTKRVVDTH